LQVLARQFFEFASPNIHRETKKLKVVPNPPHFNKGTSNLFRK